MKAVAAALLVASGLAFPWPHLPAAVERWLYNPRERTAEAIEAYKANDVRQAARHADTALRLAPDDPRVQFGAGTTQLAAGKARKAAELLERAVEAAPRDLAQAAWYNLGNARLAARDAGGAVTAYEQALLAEPANADAKHNLEIALREREKQRSSGLGGPRQDRRGRGGRDSERPGNDRQGGEQGQGEDPGQRAPRPGEGQQGRQGGEGQGRPRQGGDGSLQFRNQPDMSAAEAAALLQSVENLERQQRRAQALRRAREQAAGRKDW